MSSPIELVNQLQELAVSTYSGEQSNTFALYKAKHKITDLCFALLRAVQGPEEYTALLAESCQESAALNLVTQLGIADLIAESPNGQLSLQELCEKTQANELYLSVSLNALRYHGYFTEVGGLSSKVYANNAFSEILRTDSISGTNTMKDAVGLAADDAAKATTRLVDAALDKSTYRTPASLAFGYTDISSFEWLHSIEGGWRGRRVNKAMVQLHHMSNSGLGEDYPWENTPTPIIDIGGGVGSFESMLLSHSKNQKLDFKVFDIEKTVEHAKKVWSAKPGQLQDRVSFVAGNFMQPKPEDSKIPTPSEGAGTYIIRHVLHDWNDQQVVDILSNVRNAMQVTSSPDQKPKLLLVEMLLTEHSSRFTHTTSLQLLALNGGNTRTVVEMQKLAEEAGFSVNSVKDIRGVDLIMELEPRSV